MKLQGQNLATFSHSTVTPIAYLQHTVNINKTCVNNALNYALKKLTPDKINEARVVESLVLEQF